MNLESIRAKGGLAQLASKELDVKKEKISSKSWRIQAEVLHMNTYKLIWFNCYFPTDPQTLQYDDSELVQVLNEIENILDNNEFDDCLIGGDLNFDPSRISGFANTVRNFMSRLGISSVWETFPVDFTHLHTDSKSTSVLDHFLVNQRLLDLVEDAGPVHLGDNLSRHSPIMMRLRLPAIQARAPQPAIPRTRKPAWYKATQEDKDHYTSVLDQKLKDVDVPQSIFCADVKCQCEAHTRERDNLVLDILCSVVETSYTCIPLTGRSSATGQKQSQPLPGWKEFVAPLKKDSLFWHSVWLSAGRQTSGALYQVMCHARMKYHLAVRQAKKLAETAKARELATASEAGDIALMKELKKSLDKKDKFRECYEDL